MNTILLIFFLIIKPRKLIDQKTSLDSSYHQFPRQNKIERYENIFQIIFIRYYFRFIREFNEIKYRSNVSKINRLTEIIDSHIENHYSRNDNRRRDFVSILSRTAKRE